VKVLTLCEYTKSGYSSEVSCSILSAQAYGWRGRNSDAYCVQGQAVYSISDFNPATGAHKVNRTFDDGIGIVTYNYTIHSATEPLDVAYVAIFAANQLSVTQAGSSPQIAVDSVISQTWVNRISGNTGFRAFLYLEQYYIGGPNNGLLTGLTKLNIDLDPDYIAPTYDTGSCPLPINSGFVDTIYAKLSVTAVPIANILEVCTIGDPASVTGERIMSNLTVRFFSDAACTIPVNITGYGITQIKLAKEVNNTITDTTVNVFIAISSTGTSAYLGAFETSLHYFGCGGAPDATPTTVTTYTLQTISGKYIAVA
jgi:hypothetical protein